MNFDILIPITLFVCITYAIKAVVDARVRRQMVDSNGSQELVRSVVESEEARRRNGSLRWGVVLVALAVGFALLEAFDWKDPSPGLFAIVLAATGLGNLAYFVAARRLRD